MLDRAVTMVHLSFGADRHKRFPLSTHQLSPSGSSLFHGDPVFSGGCTTCSQKLHKPLVSHSEAPAPMQSRQDIKTGWTLHMFSRTPALSPCRTCSPGVGWVGGSIACHCSKQFVSLGSPS